MDRKKKMKLSRLKISSFVTQIEEQGKLKSGLYESIICDDDGQDSVVITQVRNCSAVECGGGSNNCFTQVICTILVSGSPGCSQGSMKRGCDNGNGNGTGYN